MPEETAPIEPGRDAQHKTGPCQQLADDLRKLDKRLWEMLDTYEGKPSLFDKAVLETSNGAISVEEAVTEIYQTMKSRVYAEDSPFKDTEVWEPFRRDKREFIDFYQSALNSLEVYREILQDYNLLSRPHLGEIERKGHDKHAHINERMACIQAVQSFHGKFHAMLDILSLLAN